MSRSFQVQISNAADSAEAQVLLVDTLKIMVKGLSLRSGSGWPPKANDPKSGPLEPINLECSLAACVEAQTRIMEAFGRAVERVLQPIFSEGFKAGYAEAQARGLDQPKTSLPMPRCVRSKQTVQRDPETGEIIGTVAEYEYDDKPGIGPGVP